MPARLAAGSVRRLMMLCVRVCVCVCWGGLQVPARLAAGGERAAADQPLDPPRLLRLLRVAPSPVRSPFPSPNPPPPPPILLALPFRGTTLVFVAFCGCLSALAPAGLSRSGERVPESARAARGRQVALRDPGGAGHLAGQHVHARLPLRHGPLRLRQHDAQVPPIHARTHTHTHTWPLHGWPCSLLPGPWPVNPSLACGRAAGASHPRRHAAVAPCMMAPCVLDHIYCRRAAVAARMMAARLPPRRHRAAAAAASCGGGHSPARAFRPGRPGPRSGPGRPYGRVIGRHAAG